jgi:hypothetical protein
MTNYSKGAGWDLISRMRSPRLPTQAEKVLQA